MNIVLATPPVAGSAWGVGSYPPLGLLYLAACVKHLPEVKVRIVDAYAEGLDVANACERVMSYSPDMFGLSATSMTFRGGWELLKRVKEARRDILTILGGFHATLFDRVLLREIEEVDVVARGEAERSFPQLCESLIRGHGISGISGISYRFRGEVVSAELQMIEDLDSLPFPDRSILDYDGYGTQWGGFTLPMVPHLATMVSSRGCIYNCTFCADKVLKTSKWRPRSADGVFLELQELSRNGSKTIFFVDENFAGDVGRVDDICHKIIGQHLKIRLGIQTSLHNLPSSTLNLMHKAGCDLAFVGVESGSEAQLKRYKKPGGRKGIAAGIQRAKAAHMFVVASFITGAPGETLRDLEDTKEFVRQVMPQICETGPLYVHPGSQIWADLVGTGEIRTVEESLSRRINTIPGQVDTRTLQGWLNDFRSNFLRSMLSWRRVLNFFNLLFHNPTVRSGVWTIVKNPRLVLRFLKKTKT